MELFAGGQLAEFESASSLRNTLRCWSASISLLVDICIHHCMLCSSDATSYLNLVHQLVVSTALDGITLSHALFHHDPCTHASDDNTFQDLPPDRNLMRFLFTLRSQI